MMEFNQTGTVEIEGDTCRVVARDAARCLVYSLAFGHYRLYRAGVKCAPVFVKSWPTLDAARADVLNAPQVTP